MSIIEMSYTDLEETIKKHLPIKIKEKNKYGEVFTPITLINEMLDKLDSSVWSNPNLTWLDPANGIGNFPMIIFERLNKGLKHVIENEQERKSHIIKNMLYMIELNENNVKISQSIFGDNANIYCGSFLEDGWKEYFGIDKFDIIVGNPPYNKNGVGKGGGVFWIPFIYSSLDNLNQNGYMCFVHPLGWRKPFKEGDRKNNAGRVWSIYKQYNVPFIKISDKKISGFPKVDYYVFQKKVVPNFQTRVINEFQGRYIDEVLNISQLDFIPNFIDSRALNIIEKLIGNRDKFNVIYNQQFKPTKKDLEKIKGIPHTYYYNPKNNTYDLVYREYETIPTYITRHKVILTYKMSSKKGNLYAKYYSTMMGSTRNTMYLEVENDIVGNKYEKFFNSKLITFLLIITQYTESPNHSNEFKILNRISIPHGLNDNPSDDDIFRYYNLNDDEINLINNYLESSSSSSSSSFQSAGLKKSAS